ncbi:MAG: MBL fold metallo-hydrolase [Clostridiales bacterium]|nr:MBL fold metallo-hydrolase [Clostridiales bacterium]
MSRNRLFYRFAAVFAVFVMLFSAVSFNTVTAKAEESLLILLQIDNPVMLANGTEKEIDEGRGTAPVIIGGRTLVPIRAVIEEFGGTVEWNGESQTAILSYNNDEIRLIINSTTAYLNDEAQTLDTAPQIINGRTMLPIRFIAESFNFNVGWDSDNSVVIITNSDNVGEVEIPESWKGAAEAEQQTSAGSSLKVHFIDVGQGDAIFIELPNNETMLIDAGPKTGIVPGYIKSCGYSSINYVVATHPDADHITGMAEVLNTFSVGTFYMPEKEHTTQTFENMIDAVSNNGCEAVYALAGKTIVDTEGLKVYFAGPVKIYDDNNACSAVVKLEYNQNSFLFTGDAEETSENDMIAAGYDLKADILKVGHHGSSSSTSAAFVKAVSPKEAIISVGADNSYGHPTAETLAVLNSAGVNIYRTDEVGTIVVTSDGVNYTIDKLKSTVEANAPPSSEGETASQEAQTAQSAMTEANEAVSSGNDSEVVYITNTGSKYHRAGCSYLKSSSIETTVAEAKNKGLSPCSRCNPPE